MRLNCFGYLYNIKGYSYHSRNFFYALSKKIDIKIVSLTYNQNEVMPAPIFELEKKGNFDINFKDPGLCIAYGNDMHKFCGHPRIGYVVFENTRLPLDWTWQLRQLDQVWTASHWGARVLAENGIADDRIRVVPEGFDPTIFMPGDEVFAPLINDKFRFLMVGKFEKRKAQLEAVAAFCQEFSPEDPVELLLLCHNVADWSQLKSPELRTWLSRPHASIKLLNPLDDPAKLSYLYRSCHVLLAPSRAEGWGLPLLEAMACACPVLATYYSGQTEFLRPDSPLLIDVQEFEDIHDDIYYPGKGEYGVWAKLSIETIRQKLRWAFNHQDAVAQQGILDADWAHRNWTWEHAADKAITILKETGL